MVLEKLERLNSLPTWQRFLLVAITTTGYLAAFFALRSSFGYVTTFLAVIPGVIAGWLFGWRGGALFGFLLAGTTQLAYIGQGRNYTSHILFDSLVIAVASMIVGYASNLIRLLRKQAGQLELEIKERERAEEYLQVREALFRSLFANSPIALWEEDLSELKNFLDERKAAGVTDFRQYFIENPSDVYKCAGLMKIIQANPRAQEMIASQTKRAANLTLDDIIAKESFDDFVNELVALVEGKTFFESRFSYTTYAGQLKHGFIQLVIPIEFADTWERVFIYDIDITENVEAEKTIQANAQKYRDLFENVSDFLYYHDLEGNFIETNLAFKNFGYSQFEADNLNVRDLLSERNQFEFDKYLQTILDIGYTQGRIKIKTKDGSVRYLEYKNSLDHDEAGNPVGIRGSARDITGQVAAEKALIKMATHDPLTNLPNRTLFEDQLNHAIKHARRYKEKLAVLFLDLDDLKTVNDSLGHEAGDAMIVEAGNRLRASIRATDTLARISGDEFTLILNHVETDDDVHTVLHKMHASLQLPLTISEHEFHLTASIGVSLFPQDGNDPHTLVRRADQAMYYAKNCGKNLHKFFHEIQ
jgi:diguanylate cyclase (GGDEF)-like protein/PAS domain S-box-containing protein